MKARERLDATLHHRQPDRLCVDFGACMQAGMGAGAVHRLRQAMLGASDYRVKIIEPYQMLGEIDEDLRRALGLDVIGIHSPNTMFGFKCEGWKPFSMTDGTPVLVPDRFNVTPGKDGGWLIYPEGDTSVPPCAYMPAASYFFDSLNRQQPLDETALDAADNCEEFTVLDAAELGHFARQARWFTENTDYGIYLTLPGMGFGDIATVPAPWLKNPKGIRGVQEWYMATVSQRDYLLKSVRAPVRSRFAEHRSAGRRPGRPRAGGIRYRHRLRDTARPVLFRGRPIANCTNPFTWR